MNYFIWGIFFLFVIRLLNVDHVDCGGNRHKKSLRLRRPSHGGNKGETTLKTKSRENDYVSNQIQAREKDSSDLDEEMSNSIRGLRGCKSREFEAIRDGLLATLIVPIDICKGEFPGVRYIQYCDIIFSHTNSYISNFTLTFPLENFATRYLVIVCIQKFSLFYMKSGISKTVGKLSPLK